MKIRIQANTDTVDIESKCLGLSAWIEGDSVKLLNTNRGLHTQIRHNGDKATFEAANRVSARIVACVNACEPDGPIMRLLQDLKSEHEAHGEGADAAQVRLVAEALAALGVK